MSAERTEPGSPKMFVIEVGPVTHYAFGKRDIARMEREMRKDLDKIVRAYVNVGPYSNAVRTRVEAA